MNITKENIFSEALNGNSEVLEHHLVDKIKDSMGYTPLHWLAWSTTFGDKIKTEEKLREWLKLRYPQFEFKKREKFSKNSIDQLINISNTERFIFNNEEQPCL